MFYDLHICNTFVWLPAEYRCQLALDMNLKGVSVGMKVGKSTNMSWVSVMCMDVDMNMIMSRVWVWVWIWTGYGYEYGNEYEYEDVCWATPGCNVWWLGPPRSDGAWSADTRKTLFAAETARPCLPTAHPAVQYLSSNKSYRPIFVIQHISMSNNSDKICLVKCFSSNHLDVQ